MRAGAIWGLSLGLLSAASSVHAAPPEGPPKPDAPLARYDEAPIFDEPPISVEPTRPIEPEPAPVPYTGVGRIVGGSLMLAGAAALFSWAGVMVRSSAHDTHGGSGCDPTVDDGGDCRNFDGLAVPIEVPLFLGGAALLGTGGVLLGTGIAAHRKYRLWERKQDDRPVPPRGDGMLGSGATLLVTGLAAGALTVVLSANHLEHPGAAAAFTTSVTVTLGGVGLVIGSGVLRRKHMRWLNARMTPSLSLLPGARPGIGGLSFGVAGRF